MKKITALCIALLAIATASWAQTRYEITVKDLPKGTKFYLVNLEENTTLDSIVSRNGTATFRGTVAFPALGYISPTRGISNQAVHFILDNTPLTLQWADEGASVQSGSLDNKRYAKAYRKYNKLQSTLARLTTEYTEQNKRLSGKIPENLKASLQTKTAETQQAIELQRQKIMADNQDNLIPMWLLLTAQRDLGNEFLLRYMPNYQHRSRVSLAPLNATLKKERYKLPGASFQDIELRTPQDQPIRLSDYLGKGNYVLVDFWASWCGPCRAEMPNVVRAYEKYHPQGFEIVGVSLDSKREAWTQAIQDMKMTWPQMSDLKYWQCEAAVLYNIRSIPSTILFGPDGKVVQAGLRGEKLQQKLAEIYGK